MISVSQISFLITKRNSIQLFKQSYLQPKLWNRNVIRRNLSHVASSLMQNNENIDFDKQDWNSISNRREYLEWLGQKIGIKEMNDWYKVNCDVSVRNHPY